MALLFEKSNKKEEFLELAKKKKIVKQFRITSKFIKIERMKDKKV